MIKAIIFDCFGVLTTSGWKQFYIQNIAGNPQKTQRAKQLMDASNTGEISYDDFISEIANLTNIHRDEVLEMSKHNVANTELLDYIRSELKPKYTISILSNAGGNWLPRMFSDEQLVLFDDVVLSYEVGVAKPAPEIYVLAAKRMGISPEQAIFVDNNPTQCEGARQAGMKATEYKDFSSFKTELEKLRRADD